MEGSTLEASTSMSLKLMLSDRTNMQGATPLRLLKATKEHLETQISAIVSAEKRMFPELFKATGAAAEKSQALASDVASSSARGQCEQGLKSESICRCGRKVGVGERAEEQGRSPAESGLSSLCRDVDVVKLEEREGYGDRRGGVADLKEDAVAAELRDAAIGDADVQKLGAALAGLTIAEEGEKVLETADQLQAGATATEEKLQGVVREMEDLQLQLRQAVADSKEYKEQLEKLQKKHKGQCRVTFVQHTSIKLLKEQLADLRGACASLAREYGHDMQRLGEELVPMARAAAQQHALRAENRRLYNTVQDLKGNIRVYCRVRPQQPSDAANHVVVHTSGSEQEITVTSAGGGAGGAKRGRDAHKTFIFDRVFGASSCQEEVFDDMKPLVRSVLDGFSVCIFAYGQTGSGKTYTMSGPNSCRAPADWGISLDSTLEIRSTAGAGARAGEGLGVAGGSGGAGPAMMMSVPEAHVEPVDSMKRVVEVMRRGAANRAMAVVTIYVHGKEVGSSARLQGRLHLVDLAGSERVERSGAAGERMREAQHINKSLAALGDVIAALAQKSAHVPYRNSKLTQILQSSLGGQAKTLMFVHVSPDADSYSETVSTLKFAERVSTVELGAARSSRDSGQLQELRDQVAMLREAKAKRDLEAEQQQQLLAASLSSSVTLTDAPTGKLSSSQVSLPGASFLRRASHGLHKGAAGSLDRGPGGDGLGGASNIVPAGRKAPSKVAGGAHNPTDRLPLTAARAAAAGAGPTAAALNMSAPSQVHRPREPLFAQELPTDSRSRGGGAAAAAAAAAAEAVEAEEEEEAQEQQASEQEEKGEEWAEEEEHISSRLRTEACNVTFRKNAASSSSSFAATALALALVSPPSSPSPLPSSPSRASSAFAAKSGGQVASFALASAAAALPSPAAAAAAADAAAAATCHERMSSGTSPAPGAAVSNSLLAAEEAVLDEVSSAAPPVIPGSSSRLLHVATGPSEAREPSEEGRPGRQVAAAAGGEGGGGARLRGWTREEAPPVQTRGDNASYCHYRQEHWSLPKENVDPLSPGKSSKEVRGSMRQDRESHAGPADTPGEDLPTAAGRTRRGSIGSHLQAEDSGELPGASQKEWAEGDKTDGRGDVAVLKGTEQHSGGLNPFQAQPQAQAQAPAPPQAHTLGRADGEHFESARQPGVRQLQSAGGVARESASTSTRGGTGGQVARSSGAALGKTAKGANGGSGVAASAAARNARLSLNARPLRTALSMSLSSSLSSTNQAPPSVSSRSSGTSGGAQGGREVRRKENAGGAAWGTVGGRGGERTAHSLADAPPDR
eukprot:jgi/Mesen1/7150/ME000037S06515